MTEPTQLLNGLKWRNIGPPRGGRVVAVAGHPTDPMTFYMGACAGGVWKTTDGGTYWENISDGYLNSAAIGALAIAESDPNVIYIGTGEGTIRGDVSYGDGVYRSTDAGRTWRHLGLTDTNHISEIRIHPQNPDIAYVAALGHAFGPNEDRGIYKTTDGGQNWEQILYVSDKAGAADLAMDPTNPRNLFASFWEVHRNFWELSSGGGDSSLHHSTDGGETWHEITNNPGLPAGIWGKSGVTVSAAMPNRVWAVVEAEDAGVYRSDDYGETWSLMTTNSALVGRPWYYCHIFADPQDPETVYINNFKMWKSTDGGKNFTEVTTPHGDNHDLWIDPQDPQRMINGNDGGACVSYNGGITWSNIYNQMTGQFYHVDVDNQFPYHVYGTQQDNSSIAVPSATEHGCIPWSHCFPAGTGESGHIAVNPDDHNEVFVGAVGSSPGGGGALQRYDHRTKQVHIVSIWPDLHYGNHPKDMKYRFPWTFPILYSPHDTGTVYACGNHVFKTQNGGRSWEEISPDLTRNDKSKQNASGGPLTLDTSGAEIYGAIFAFAESPHEEGVFWAGTDDGLVHISRDGGASWQAIRPDDLPELAMITHIEPSPFDAATAYLSATMYKLDDYRPYLYKTSDYGQTWQRIDEGYPQDQITRVIREDPQKQGLLYVGSETGIFVSFDDGSAWTKFSGNFPVVPVYDLKVKDDDLVVATHGRGFWILDDITPLRQYDPAAGNHLFPPRDTVRRWQNWSVGVFGAGGGSKNYMISLGGHATYINTKDEYGAADIHLIDAGTNPPNGVVFYYTLSAETDLSMVLSDNAGNEIKTFTSPPEAPEKEQKEPYLPNREGLNRFVWNMRYPDAVKLKDPLTENNRTGPAAAPGTYTATLTIGEETHEVTFAIVPDPRATASQADYDAQFKLWSDIRDKISAAHTAVQTIRTVKEQVDGWQKRGKEADNEEISTAAEALTEKLTAIEGELVQIKAETGFDRLKLPAKLNAKLMNVIAVVASADEAPTQQAHDIFAEFAQQVDGYTAELDTLMADDVQAFNAIVQKAAVPAITV